MTCTWENCRMPGVQGWWNRSGNQWADLCKYHNDTLCSVIISCDLERTVRTYLSAAGGPEKAIAALKAV